MALNWANILALILQILSQIKPAPSPAPAAVHLESLRTQLADAGVIEADIQKALAFVQANWAAILALVTAAEAAFGPNSG